MSYNDLTTKFFADLFLFNSCPCCKHLACFLNRILNITTAVADILRFHQSPSLVTSVFTQTA